MADVFNRLAELVRQSIQTVNIYEPSTDYYKRDGDFTTAELAVISSRDLVEALENLAQELSQH